VISSVLLLDMFQMDVQGRLVLELRRRSDFSNDAFNILSHRHVSSRRCRMLDGVYRSVIGPVDACGDSERALLVRV
jgi:hypothetical protein